MGAHGTAGTQHRASVPAGYACRGLSCLGCERLREPSTALHVPLFLLTPSPTRDPPPLTRAPPLPCSQDRNSRIASQRVRSRTFETTGRATSVTSAGRPVDIAAAAGAHFGGGEGSQREGRSSNGVAEGVSLQVHLAKLGSWDWNVLQLDYSALAPVCLVVSASGSRQRSPVPGRDRNCASISLLLPPEKVCGLHESRISPPPAQLRQPSGRPCGGGSSWDIDVGSSTSSRSGPLPSPQMFKVVRLSQMCEPENLERFVNAVLDSYNAVPYHNAWHAVDCLHAMMMLLVTTPALWRSLTVLDRFALMLAALTHDTGHLGVNNAFLIANRDRLALMYNDHAVQESMHAALSFQIALQRDGCNIFSKLSEREFARCDARTPLGTVMLAHPFFPHLNPSPLCPSPPPKSDPSPAGSAPRCSRASWPPTCRATLRLCHSCASSSPETGPSASPSARAPKHARSQRIQACPRVCILTRAPATADCPPCQSRPLRTSFRRV